MLTVFVCMRLHVRTWNMKTQTRTQQRPVNHTFIRYCCDAHSTAEERERGAGENRWRQTEQVNDQGENWKRGNDGAKMPQRSSRNHRLIFPVCVPGAEGLIVCLWYSPLYSFLTWWLGLPIPHLLQQTILLNGHSVHVLREGNGSQWWEMMIAIYRALKIPQLPLLCQSLARCWEFVTDWISLKKKGRGRFLVPGGMNSLISHLTFTDAGHVADP